ncbi:unnamed protein product [Calicophoron daubneyi]|uniref:Uncharacterized protein n=1 Tax=Calicophoron daubneyi TaxID=300641 RepID=A0AAV2U0N0_CALDB
MDRQIRALMPLIFAIFISYSDAIRYDRTTEYRRKRRIELKARLPVDMHLPLIDPAKQATAMLVVYLACIITLLLSFILILFFDRSILRTARRVFCFCCCCVYGCGRFWSLQIDGPLELEDEDDSADELFCFKVSESVKRKRLITIIDYGRMTRKAEKESEQEGERKSMSASKTRLFTDQAAPPKSMNKNYKQKDNLLKVRLEFLTDLAAYMSARTAQQIVSEESSTADNDSARTDSKVDDQLLDNDKGIVNEELPQDK